MKTCESFFSTLLRGNPDELIPLTKHKQSTVARYCSFSIVIGFALYGFTVGIWRAPLMGIYVACKMPCLIFLTLACNGLLNGIFAILLGSGLGMRESLLGQLMSFSISSLILGTLAPIVLFLGWSLPGPSSQDAASTHSQLLLIHIILIAYAGIISNLHLYRFLTARIQNSRTALQTLIAWLAGNAFMGAQFSWILRPFFGTPSLEVSFLREDPMNGTFYEAAWRSLKDVVHQISYDFSASSLFFIPAAFALFLAIRSYKKPKKYDEQTQHS